MEKRTSAVDTTSTGTLPKRSEALPAINLTASDDNVKYVKSNSLFMIPTASPKSGIKVRTAPYAYIESTIIVHGSHTRGSNKSLWLIFNVESLKPVLPASVSLVNMMMAAAMRANKDDR